MTNEEAKKENTIDDNKLRTEIRRRVKLSRIQEADRIIKLWDETIIKLYHEWIVCDKYAIMSAEQRPKYNRYREFVMNMPENYRFFIDALIEMVYPLFLLEIHNTDSELVQITRNLPTEPIENTF